MKQENKNIMNRTMSFLAATLVVVGMLLGWGNLAQAQSDEVLITKAEQAMVKKDYVQAIELYTQLSNRNKDMSVYKVNLALAYMSMNDVCSGLKWFEQASKNEDLPQSDAAVIQTEYLEGSYACQTLTVTIIPPKKGVKLTVEGKLVATTDKNGKATIAKPFTSVGQITLVATTDNRTASTTVDIPYGIGEKSVTITLPKPTKGNGIVWTDDKKTDEDEFEVGTKHLTVIGVGTLSLALVTGGVFANISAAGKYGELETLAGKQARGELRSPAEAAKLQGELDDMNQLMTAMYISGGLLAAADVALFFYWEAEETNNNTPTVTITPMRDGGTAVFTLPF